MIIISGFKYQYAAIQSVSSLAAALQIEENHLRQLAKKSNEQYIGPIEKEKKDGGKRYVFDTKPRLKNILKKINKIFFRKVDFPDFLKGSLKDQTHIKNAATHIGCKTLIQEDIKSFYDHISSAHVHKIWTDFFHFSNDVADVLTDLTTRNGFVQQGTPTSSYIANLVFFKHENNIFEELKKLNIRYTRYVDDIALSSLEIISKKDKSFAISKIRGMIKGYGFKPHPKKQSITPNPAKPLQTVTGLNVGRNSKPSVPKSERAKIRAHMYQIESMDLETVEISSAIKEVSRINGRIAILKNLHPNEHEKLRCKLQLILIKITDRLSKAKTPTTVPSNP